mgnify:CR=1 FL=1
MNEENFYYMSRAEMKSLARDRLKQPGVWLKFALAALIPGLVAVITTYLTMRATSAIGDTTSLTTYMVNLSQQMQDSYKQDVLSNLILIFFTTGISFTALDLVRDRAHKVTLGGILLRCFNSRYFWSVLGVDILVYVAVQIGTVFLIIPGILLSYGLAMAYFVLYDAREHGDQRDLFNVLAESYRMMRGHKFDLFVLHLSFIGWSLLVVVTAGLAYFWVYPYMQLTTAAFYEQVRVQYNKTRVDTQDDGQL